MFYDQTSIVVCLVFHYEATISIELDEYPNDIKESSISNEFQIANEYPIENEPKVIRRKASTSMPDLSIATL
jgi:hypothetical protein